MQEVITMSNNCDVYNLHDYIPIPVYGEHPEYNVLYFKAWEIAFKHIKHIDGMPQTPYMDEAFCDTQIWIWDTCFMSLFCKYANDLFPCVESLKNFYEVLYNGKKLPEVIPTESEPVWTGAKSGVAFEMQVHIADNPPLFAWSEYQNALFKGDKDYLRELLYNQCFLQKHYSWFENLKEGYTPNGVCVNTCLISTENGFKWEGGRSGMDNTPRGRKGDTAVEKRPHNPDLLWIDAINQQALAAKMIAEMFKILADEENYNLWYNNFLQKAKIINDLYWDNDDLFYYDIENNNFNKVKTIASFWALTSCVAPFERAEKLANLLKDKNTFGGEVPFVSLSRNDGDFSRNGKYWRGSVWLPTAYATLVGLKNYGFYSLARETSLKLLNHIYKTYKEFSPHTIWECYSPSEYKPATNANDNRYVRPDFCGWSALGPISVYIEFVLGFHTVDAFKNIVEWYKPEFDGEIGVKNLRFGKIVTDIVAVGNECTVVSNNTYTLKINGKEFEILKGNNKIKL